LETAATVPQGLAKKKLCFFHFPKENVAPAPQRRFRKRLEQIHGARVTLIQEAYTSQKCSKCYSQLEAWKSATTSNRGRVFKDATLAVRPGGVCCPTTRCARAKEIHGVRVCLTCRGNDDQEKSSIFRKSVAFSSSFLAPRRECRSEHGRQEKASPFPFSEGKCSI
jgi:hypothetical protein